jgi:hypothetical protein
VLSTVTHATIVVHYENAMTELDRALTFHIEGPLTDAHTLPASVLVQILENAQRAFELIGLQVEGKTVKARARLAKSSAEKFQLICELPVHGCYAMPVVVGGASNDLFAPEQAAAATQIFKNLMVGIQSRNREEMANILPDGSIRKRVLESIKGMLPQFGSGWRLDLHDSTGVSIASVGDWSASFIDEIAVPAEELAAAQTVTGELRHIDFAARKLTILYPVTRREMDCFYPEELEDLLFKNRRDLLQVTGMMILDDSGVPKAIDDVTDIREVDLSPFSFSRLSRDTLVLTAKRPLKFVPMLDESSQYICLRDDSLGIEVFAETRQKVALELDEQIAMLWSEYALADDDSLDEIAQGLKQRLLLAFDGVIHAA